MTQQNETMMRKINALLNKTIENGATEAEANAAMEMAQRLMTQHMIDESQLSAHAKAAHKKCVSENVDIFKTGYDTSDIVAIVADAFDCQAYWRGDSKVGGVVTFFGWGEDSKLAAYFYSYLNHAVVNAATEYIGTEQYRKSKAAGYGPKTIMKSFRRGMIGRIGGRFAEMKEERTRNVVTKTGTNLVVVKEDAVREEFDKLGMTFRDHKADRTIDCRAAALDGIAKANSINMSGGIGSEPASKSIAAG